MNTGLDPHFTMKPSIRNILGRTSGTAGASTSRLISASSSRSGLLFANLGESSIYLAFIEPDEELPALSSSLHDLAIGPGAQVALPLSSSVQLAIMSAGDDSDYRVIEFDGDPGWSLPTTVNVESEAPGIAMSVEDSPHQSGDPGIMALAVVNGGGGGLASDGDYSALQLDSTGNLRVVTSPVSMTPTTGELTTEDQGVSITLNKSHFVLVSLVSAGADAEVSFHASIDGTAFAPISARRVDNGHHRLVQSAVLEDEDRQFFALDLRGFISLRLICDEISAGAVQYVVRPYSWNAESAASLALAQSPGGEGLPLQADAEGRLKVEASPSTSDDWSYACPFGGVSSGPVTIKAAASSGQRNYITSLQVINSHSSTEAVMFIEDGDDNVLWRMRLAAGQGISVAFPRGLRSAEGSDSALSLSFDALGQVYFDAQGYSA